MSSPEDEPGTRRIDTDPPLTRLMDDLLADILLRLPDLADVGRAATVSPTFARVVADRSFRLSLRSTHPEPYLGFLFGRFYSVKNPHRFAPYARALMRSADFSFSFIPAAGPWLLRDARDGRVLLESSETDRELAVADPVFRRYALLPPIPDDLGAPVLQQRRVHLETFLIPKEKEETSFKVICIAVRRSHLVAFVFSSDNRGWSAFPFEGWSALTEKAEPKQSWFRLRWRFCAGSCFYWRMDWMDWTDELLVLDTGTMAFSVEKTTRRRCDSCSAIVMAGDGGPEIFVIKKIAGTVSRRVKSLYSVRQSKAGSVNVWNVTKKVPVRFPLHSKFIITGAVDGYLLLHGSRYELIRNRYRQKGSLETDYFLLVLKTMQLEKVCPSANILQYLHLYTGFPPSLSLPSI